MARQEMYAFTQPVEVPALRKTFTIPSGIHAVLDFGADTVTIVVGVNHVEMMRFQWTQLLKDGAVRKK